MKAYEPEKSTLDKYGISHQGSGKRNNKAYFTISFYTAADCEQYWIDRFFNNPECETKVVDKTIIYWGVDKR